MATSRFFCVDFDDIVEVCWPTLIKRSVHHGGDLELNSCLHRQPCSEDVVIRLGLRICLSVCLSVCPCVCMCLYSCVFVQGFVAWSGILPQDNEIWFVKEAIFRRDTFFQREDVLRYRNSLMQTANLL